MKYIPKETHVKSTSEVINIFEKHNSIEGGPVDEEQAEEDAEGELTYI